MLLLLLLLMVAAVELLESFLLVELIFWFSMEDGDSPSRYLIFCVLHLSVIVQIDIDARRRKGIKNHNNEKHELNYFIAHLLIFAATSTQRSKTALNHLPDKAGLIT